jgi:hypothetical protein
MCCASLGDTGVEPCTNEYADNCSASHNPFAIRILRAYGFARQRAAPRVGGRTFRLSEEPAGRVVTEAATPPFGHFAAILAAEAEAERETVWQAGFGNALLSQIDAIGDALNLHLLLF